MNKIIKMSPQLSNMIAAGEVVSRPASVLKELIENSLDASSTNIVIEVKGFGLEMIKVSDDGKGISQEDLPLAFERHATSKLTSEKDLTRIMTLGFRGEAIPSIASVSKMQIISRQKESDGYQVTYENGQLLSEGIASSNFGTTVTVWNMFYNTPARFKYIKSEHTERAVLIDTFNKLSLSNPNVSFKLIIDDKEVKKTLGNGDYQALIAHIYGDAYLDNLTVFENSFQKITMKAHLVSPHLNKSNRYDINVFVNGRYIRNFRLMDAVTEGYHGYLMNQRFPVAFIHLNMDASIVDVNVHPQKSEVKFANDYVLAYHITEFIRSALKNRRHEISTSFQTIRKEVTKEEGIRPEFKTLDFREPLILSEEKSVVKTVFEESYEKLPYMEYVGSVLGTYLIYQNEEGMFLIDQHAAAEKIRYEALFEKLSTPNIELRDLIIPYQFNFSNDQLLSLNHFENDFKKLGFKLDKETLVSIPSWLKNEEIEIVVETILNLLADNSAIDYRYIRDELAKDISCKGAIKANHQLSIIETNHLMMELRKLKNPYTCPHGRPILIKITKYEIEKMFKRVVS